MVGVEARNLPLLVSDGHLETPLLERVLNLDFLTQIRILPPREHYGPLRTTGHVGEST